MGKKTIVNIGWLFALPGLLILVSLACIDPEVTPTEDAEISPVAPAAPGTQLAEQTSESVYAIAIQGNMAYLGLGTQLALVDITSPEALVLVGKSDGFPWLAADLAVAGDHVFVANGSNGLRIMHVADPAAPVEISHLRVEGGTTEVVLSGDYAYLAVSFSGLVVVNIADPTRPQQVGFLPLEDIVFYGLSISGDFAYLVDMENGLRVISISDPSNPRQVSNYQPSKLITALAISGNYAYVSDLDALLRVVDISDPYDPVGRGYVPLTQDGEASDIAISGKYAYLACGMDGVLIIDISDPLSPREISRFETSNDVDLVAARDGYIYLSGLDGVIQVVDVSDPSHPKPEGAILKLHR
jgi:hypothetical protein